MLENQEVQTTVSIKEMFKKDYNIELSNEDNDRIISIMDSYNVQPNEVTFQTATSIETYVSSLTEYRRINSTRKKVEILISEVIYELIPTFHSIDENIEINYPHRMHHKASVATARKNEFIKNIALMRDIDIKCDEKTKDISYHYTFIIFNSELDIRAGIRFEKI